MNFGRRNRIYRVTRKRKVYFVRGFDAYAVQMVAQQMGFPVTTCIRAPGHSREAIDLFDYQSLERKRK